MAQPRSLIVTLYALALLLGCLPVVHGLEDFSVLLQGPTTPPASGQIAEKEELAIAEEGIRARWPDLEHLWDEVKESVKQVTDQVGEVTDEAISKADELEHQMEGVAGDTAQKIANALNHALRLVRKEADGLLSETAAEKTEFIAQLNHSLALANDTILPDFERAAKKAITSVWGRWQSLRLLIHRSADKIEGGLRAAGQGEMASRLDIMTGDSLDSLDSFLSRLRETDDDLHGLGTMGLREAEDALLRVNDELNKALQHVAAFVAKFQQSYQEVTERICNALVLSTEEVDRAFSSVQHNVTSISWRVRSSGREIALGMHRGIVMVARSKNMTTPEWRPVTVPPNAVLFGAAGGPQLPLLVLLAAGLAALVAAEGR